MVQARTRRGGDPLNGETRDRATEPARFGDADAGWSEDRRRFAADNGSLTRTKESEDLRPGPLAREFAALAAVLCDVPVEAGVIGVLSRIVHAAARMIDGADVVSVTLREDDGRLSTPVETDALATRLDAAQYELGEGPSILATTTPDLGLTYGADLADSPDWPRFGPLAAGLGVRSALATGVFPDGRPPRRGTLNYYSWSPRGFDHVDRDAAVILAAHCGAVLAHAEARTAAELQTSQLRRGLESRDIIGQAKGILMERRGYGSDQAFEALRRASQHLNIKLATIATTVVHRRSEL